MFVIRNATHLSIYIEKEDNECTLKLKVFSYFADIDPLGPVIDGDIVVQGAIVDDRFLPSLCTLEIENDNGSRIFEEVLTVPPVKMMLNTTTEGDDLEDAKKFLIPITMPPEHADKLFRVRIYFQERHLVSIDEENADFASPENRKSMILAVESIPNAVNAVSVSALEDLLDMNPENIKQTDNDENNGDNLASPKADADEEKAIADEEERLMKSGQVLEDDDAYGESGVLGNGSATIGKGDDKLVLQEVHIASDYDDLVAFQADGFQLVCTHITPTGPVQDQDHLWKFHVVGKYGDPSEPGVEDIVFVKCLKSMGQLPVLPFYQILHDFDLSDPDDGYAVYLGIKKGPKPCYRKLVMLSSNLEDEDHLKHYIESVHGVYRSAPEELERSFRGRCGLLFITHRSKNTATAGNGGVAIGDNKGANETAGEGSRLSKGSHQDDDEDDMDDDDDMEDEEELMQHLRDQIDHMESEKMQLATMNTDLQKRAVLLMQREKALQGQAAGAGGNRNADTANGSSTANGANNGNATADTELTYEQSIEKEKQYHDVLRVIVEARNKLEKQLRDFEQLAVDLQTRLDDKEFNAKSISSSFKQFKRYVFFPHFCIIFFVCLMINGFYFFSILFILVKFYLKQKIVVLDIIFLKRKWKQLKLQKVSARKNWKRCDYVILVCVIYKRNWIIHYEREKS